MIDFLLNPVMAAAGCFGYGVEAEGQVDLSRLGAIVTRGTTLQPRSGAPAPRMVEAPSGLLHAIGHQNPGIAQVLERFAPRWATWTVPVILNLAASSAEDFASMAGRADVPGVAALEIDLASPDLARRGRPISLDPAAAARVTAAVRQATDLPVIVKLSPAAGDVRALTRAVVEAGANALTCGGGMPASGATLGSSTGTLSGPAIRPIAIRMVEQAHDAVSVPIIGCGGVATVADVLAMLAAGAAAVQIGTALLADPTLAGRLADELRLLRPPV